MTKYQETAKRLSYNEWLSKHEENLDILWHELVYYYGLTIEFESWAENLYKVYGGSNFR
jgi:hypothetical protein